MRTFKRAIFGGYKRAAVDDEMRELNGRIEELEREKEKSELKAELAQEKIGQLENRVAIVERSVVRLKTENDSLAAENEALTQKNGETEELYGDIAKIYGRAYGAGREIVCDSKETAEKMLGDLDRRFDLALSSSKEILARYEEIERNINLSFAALQNDISAVAHSAKTAMINAKSFCGIYEDMKRGVQEVRLDGERLLCEYEKQSSEFAAGSKDTFSGKLPTEDPSSEEGLSDSIVAMVSGEEQKIISPAAEQPTEKKAAPRVRPSSPSDRVRGSKGGSKAAVQRDIGNYGRYRAKKDFPSKTEAKKEKIK